MRVPAADAFGSGHKVGERIKIALGDDDDINRRRVVARNDERLNIIIIAADCLQRITSETTIFAPATSETRSSTEDERVCSDKKSSEPQLLCIVTGTPHICLILSKQPICCSLSMHIVLEIVLLLIVLITNIQACRA